MDSIDRVGEIWYNYGPAIPPKVVDGKLVPQMTPLFEALAAELDRAKSEWTPEQDDRYYRMYEFCQWIIALDDDDPDSPGRKERQTITLNKIIEKARGALRLSDYKIARSADGDWIALIKGTKVVHQGHSISEELMLELLGINYESLGEFDVADTGWFPDDLDDWEKEGVFKVDD